MALQGHATVRNGADQLEKLLPLLEGKRVSLVVNHTSLCGKTHLLDTLVSLVKIVRVFAPEHGFRGDADAGEYIQNGKDTRTGGAHPFTLWKKQETATVTTDWHGCGSVRHTRRRCPASTLTSVRFIT